MQFSARTSIAKTNMPSIERSFHLLDTCTTCAFFSIIERSVLMTLVFYHKDLLEKVTTQRAQQFSAFSLLPKEPSLMQRMRSCSKN